MNRPMVVGLSGAPGSSTSWHSQTLSEMLSARTNQHLADLGPTEPSVVGWAESSAEVFNGGKRAPVGATD